MIVRADIQIIFFHKFHNIRIRGFHLGNKDLVLHLTMDWEGDGCDYYNIMKDGDLYRITPAKPYTAADLDWNDKKSRSSVEMGKDDSRPELGGEPIEVKDYDVIFLGYPIWWNLCPRLVNTFIEKYGFAGKTVIPFATSGGSSITNSVKDLMRRYPKVTWKEGRLLNGGRGQAAEWAKQVIEK